MRSATAARCRSPSALSPLSSPHAARTSARLQPATAANRPNRISVLPLEFVEIAGTAHGAQRLGTITLPLDRGTELKSRGWVTRTLCCNTACGRAAYAMRTASWRCRQQRSVLLPACGGGGSSSAPAPHFVDDTSASGIDHRYDGEFEYFVGGGVAAFDCDDDGRDELFLAGGSEPAALYHNDSPDRRSPPLLARSPRPSPT